jgi:hypothetical protein
MTKNIYDFCASGPPCGAPALLPWHQAVDASH